MIWTGAVRAGGGGAARAAAGGRRGGTGGVAACRAAGGAWAGSGFMMLTGGIDAADGKSNCDEGGVATVVGAAALTVPTLVDHSAE